MLSFAFDFLLFKLEPLFFFLFSLTFLGDFALELFALLGLLFFAAFQLLLSLFLLPFELSKPLFLGFLGKNRVFLFLLE